MVSGGLTASVVTGGDRAAADADAGADVVLFRGVFCFFFCGTIGVVAMSITK